MGKSPPVCTSTTGGGELQRFEPVSDEVMLAVIDRAERHREVEFDGVPLGEIVTRLGFVRSGWRTR